MNLSSSKIVHRELSITALEISDKSLTAHINDGRIITIPLSWFEKLHRASSEDLQKFEISPNGYGIHWLNLDEDISIKAFIDP